MHVRIAIGMTFAFSLVLAAYSGAWWERTHGHVYAPLHTNSAYRFVDPIAAVGEDITPSVSNSTLNDLKKIYEHSVAVAQASGDITIAGIYFRELHDGGWTSVNAQEKFVPRSLLKVPLAMALMHTLETDGSSLPPVITFGGGDSQDVVQDYQPAKKLQVGESYTLDELMCYILQYSENNAAMLLSQILGVERLQKVYTELGIEIPQAETYTMSVRTYASLFRILFNASYLNLEHSEEILALLADTEFTHGIVAGLPQGTVVAHKFGELEAGDVRQLHDCGIVYAPKNPYILCVMTQGRDFKKLEAFIADISKSTYERTFVNYQQ